MMATWLRLVMLAFVVTVATSSKVDLHQLDFDPKSILEQLPPTDKPPTHGWVRDWLASVSFPVNYKNRTDPDMFGHSINLTCSNISLGDVHVSTTQPDKPDGNKSQWPNATFTLVLEKVDIYCKGMWFEHIFNKKTSGPAQVNISIVNFETNASLIRNTPSGDGLIESAAVAGCHAKNSISLEIDAWNKAERDIVEGVFDFAINEGACLVVSDLVNTNISSALFILTTVIEMCNNAVVNHRPPAPKGIVIEFFGNPIVDFLAYLIDDFMGAGNVDRLIDVFFPSGSIGDGNITKNLTIPFLNNTMTFGLTSLNISGLDSFSNLSLLEPIKMMSPNKEEYPLLDFKFGIDHLDLDLSFFVEVAPTTSHSDSLFDTETNVFFDNGLFDPHILNTMLRVGGVLETPAFLQRNGSTERSVAVTGAELMFGQQQQQQQQQQHQQQQKQQQQQQQLLQQQPHLYTPPLTEPLLQWFHIKTKLRNISFNALVEIVINETMAAKLYSGEKLDPGCIIPAIEKLNITYLDLRSNLTLNLDLFAGDVDRDVDESLQAVLQLIFNISDPVLATVIQAVIGNQIQGVINDALAKAIVPTANTTCTIPDLSHQSLALYLVPTSLVIVLGVGLFFVTGKFINAKSKGYSTATSLSLSPALLKTSGYRFAIVFMLTGAVAFCITGMLASGSEMLMELVVDGQLVVRPAPLYYLSLFQSIHDCYESRTYVLLAILAFPCAVWPVGRLFVLIYVCLVPFKSHSWQYALTSISDMFGKWAVSQQLVAILVIVAFRFHVEVPGGDNGIDVNSTGVVDLYFFMDWWGDYGILCSTFFGLLLSHFILRKIHERELEAVDAQDTELPSLLSSVNVVRKIVVVTLFAVAISALAFGMTMPAFSFTYLGGVAAIQRATNTTSTHEYTLLSLVEWLPKSTKHNDFQVATSQMTVVLFMLVLPGLHMAACLAAWVVPMRRSQIKNVVTTLHTLMAWSMLDVMVISIVANFVQIKQFAVYIVGDKCDLLKPLLAMPQVKQYLLDGDPKCLDVSGAILYGTYVLAAAAFVSQGLGAYTLHLLRKRGGYYEDKNIAKQNPSDFYPIMTDSSETYDNLIN